MEQAGGRDARTGRSHPEGLLVVPYAPVHSAALRPAMSTYVARLPERPSRQPFAPR
jgi:hypothetical protein